MMGIESTKQRGWKPRSTSRLRRAAAVAQLLAGSWRESTPPTVISPEELDDICILLLKCGTSALAWRKIRHSHLGTSYSACKLQQMYRFHSLEAALYERRLKKVIPVFRSFGAEPVLVKGWAVARLYPEAGLRPYCDVDLCVSQVDYKAARAALRSPESQGCLIDLHMGFGKFYERQTDEVFARTRLVNLDGVDVRVLCPEDDLRFLCLHLLRHGAVRPLWLTDIAVLLESLTDDFDWDQCLSGSRRQADWVACAVCLAHHLLDVDLRRMPLARRIGRLPSWFIAPILKAWGTPARSPMQVAALLRDPLGLLKELRHHWPNPIEATMTLRGPFNEIPRLPFQVGHVLSRTAALLSQIPAGH